MVAAKFEYIEQGRPAASGFDQGRGAHWLDWTSGISFLVPQGLWFAQSPFVRRLFFVVPALLLHAAGVQQPATSPLWVRTFGFPDVVSMGKVSTPDATMYLSRPTFFQQHREEAPTVVLALLLQAGLLVGLLFERHRRRNAERVLLTHGYELGDPSRIAIAGELTATIAHEVNQPLGAILTNAEAGELMLKSDVKDHGSKLLEIFSAIRRDSLRAGEIVRRLRVLIGKHEIEYRIFEVNDAVVEIESILRAEAKSRNVILDVRLASASSPILGDRTQVQQIVINLVLNAMDALGDLPESRRTIVVFVEKGLAGVSIEVRDRGQGVRPDHLPKLFDSFFTTKPMGMGLGLSIARTVVRAHGGRIWAESNDLNGTVFHVELPALDMSKGPPSVSP